jgi:hypothetical protein
MPGVIATSLRVGLDELEQGTGWEIKPEGACKDVRCVPLPEGAVADGTVDLRAVADRLGMALVDSGDGLWALGPESGGRALASAELPDIELPDRAGHPFALRSLLGTRFLLLAWASW